MATVSVTPKDRRKVREMITMDEELDFEEMLLLVRLMDKISYEGPQSRASKSYKDMEDIGIGLCTRVVIPVEMEMEKIKYTPIYINIKKKKVLKCL